MRRTSCFPKTTIPRPTCQHPKGFRSVNNSMSWSTAFLKRLTQEFGHQLVAHKLSEWKWSCTTCFSGVGCAETVRCPQTILWQTVHVTMVWFQLTTMPTCQKMSLPGRHCWAFSRQATRCFQLRCLWVDMSTFTGPWSVNHHVKESFPQHMVVAASMMSWSWERRQQHSSAKLTRSAVLWTFPYRMVDSHLIM